jgi:hypothetical protein
MNFLLPTLKFILDLSSVMMLKSSNSLAFQRLALLKLCQQAPSTTHQTYRWMSLPQSPQKQLTMIENLGPGCALAFSVMGTGFLSAEYIGSWVNAMQGISNVASPISGKFYLTYFRANDVNLVALGIPMSILLGMLLNNSTSLPDSVRPGLKFCSSTILRLGIVCIGIKLSALEMASLGVAGVPVVRP